MQNEEAFADTLFSGESVSGFDPDHEAQRDWRADEIVAGGSGSAEGK